MWYKLSFLLLLAASNLAWGQLNMRLISQLSYEVDLNDVWGYEAPDGTEYALVGKADGVSVVSLADPENAVEVASIPGQVSIWRDIKTYGEFAYVTTDQPGTAEGVTVIDLRSLPESVSYYHWTDFSFEGSNYTLTTCHNIYVDEAGYAYLAGCNLNGGGILYLDLFSTPGTPIFVGAGPPVYAHDVYVQDNRMYSSEIYVGQMAIYDVTDKANTVLLGTVNTPFNFTHNIWVNEDASVAFTTDERANAPVAAYSIVDPEDIIELDQYRPAATLGEDVIPHNVHVWNNYLIVSYYTDGGKIVDASRPHNLVEVGSFDTFFGNAGGFSGSWGAYPFFSSGLVLLTDINNGLFVLEPTYQRAAFLEGKVTEVNTGRLLEGVRVVLNSDTEANINLSGLDGSYATGLATAGTYSVRFARQGYEPLDTIATISNGELTVLDVELAPLAKYTVRGVVRDQEDGTPIQWTQVLLRSETSTYETETNAEGAFVLEDVFKEEYELVLGAWGYRQTVFDTPLRVDGEEVWNLELERGYEDDFFFDLGWRRANFGASRGNWERGEPIGTSDGGQAVNTNFDIPTDLGENCWMTENRGGGAGSGDVDRGMVQLRSPTMALASRYERPILSYDSWFFNAGGDNMPNDSLVVRLTNGADTVTLETVQESRGDWRERQFFSLDTIPIVLTDDMRIIFEASDYSPGHFVEAAVDVFRVEEGAPLSNTNALPTTEVELQLAPNPFRDQLQVTYAFAAWTGQANVKLYDALGQVVHSAPLRQSSGQLQIDLPLPAGLYWLSLQQKGYQARVQKVVKQ